MRYRPRKTSRTDQACWPEEHGFRSSTCPQRAAGRARLQRDMCRYHRPSRLDALSLQFLPIGQSGQMYGRAKFELLKARALPWEDCRTEVCTENA